MIDNEIDGLFTSESKSLELEHMENFKDPFTSKKESDLLRLREFGIISDRKKAKKPNKNRKKRRR